MGRSVAPVCNPVWGEIYKVRPRAYTMGAPCPQTPRLGGNWRALMRPKATEPTQPTKTRFQTQNIGQVRNLLFDKKNSADLSIRAFKFFKTYRLSEQPGHVRGGLEVLDENFGFTIPMHTDLRHINFGSFVRREKNIIMRRVFLRLEHTWN